MLKITTTVLALIMSFSAAAQHIIKLSPNESKSLSNPTLWTLNATCHIQGGKGQHKIQIRMIDKTGHINGHALANGKTTSVHVNNKEQIAVSADAGATVHLTNLDNDPVEAVCYS